MTSESEELASGDLDALLNEHFAGKIVSLLNGDRGNAMRCHFEVTDAGAGHRHGSGCNALLMEHRQAADSGLVLTDPGIVVEGGGGGDANYQTPLPGYNTAVGAARTARRA